jgi:enamine deaminase RidA (YjgF/YER057c/UK114 family)
MTQDNTAIQRLNSNQIMSAVTIHQQTVYLSGQVPSNLFATS